jgi:histone H3/H4
LIEVYNFIQNAMDQGKEGLLIFCDMSKAFDRVWHQGLVHKLARVGIRGDLLDWCASYLSNRKQRVVIHGQTSSEADITSGVPQGSILGPLFFLVYMNDIADNIKAEIRLYADDVTLYIDYNDQQAAKIIIEEDLAKIMKWAKDWYMSFNPDKTEQLHFSRKRNHIPIEIKMENKQISIVKSHKHLGVIIQQDGKWSEHLDSISAKAYRRLDILRSLSKQLDKLSLQKLYLSFIRPILEFSSPVWGNLNRHEEEMLEEIQRSAIRVVTGAKRGTSHEPLYAEVGWPTLEERRKYQMLVMIFKMINNLAPPTLTELLPDTKADRNPYHIRAGNDLDTPRARTSAYADSFLPYACTEWNNLPDDIRNIPSLEEFSETIKPPTRPPPPHYSTGNRRNQILICRLRVGNADLNSNLFERNMADNSTCACEEEDETTEHFLINCELYNDQRQTMLQELGLNPQEITPDLLLRGSSDLSERRNKCIIEATQKFISKSGRFN